MVLQDFMPEFTPAWARIKVFGVGWAGSNTVKRMVLDKMEWVDFVAVNTDAQALANNPAPIKINIGLNLTRWLGAWANPEVGRKAAEESFDDLKKYLVDTDMIFITAGMWGGTWTGAAPVIGQLAREMGILTVWVVTKPFSFEGKARFQNASEGIEKMKWAVDTLLIIPNDKIFNIVDKKTTFNQAFLMVDKILRLWVQGITDLIVNPGEINIDFADLKRILANSGNALLGIWYWEGENRAVEAARRAIENPLMENRLTWAKNIIFAVTGSHSVTPIEVQEASRVIEEIADPDVNLIWGMTLDENYNDDEIKITVIATWFQWELYEEPKKATFRDWTGKRVPSGGEDFATRILKDSSGSGIRSDREYVDNVSRNNSNSSYGAGFNNTSLGSNNDNNMWSMPPAQDDEDLDVPAFARRKVS